MKLKQPIKAHIKQTYLNTLQQGDHNYTFSREVSYLRFTIDGIEGDRHEGRMMTSGARTKNLHEPGTQIFNYRQWLGVTQEEISHVCEEMGEDITPEMFGTNFVLEGSGLYLSQMPIGTRIVLSSHDSFKRGRLDDTVLITMAQAAPCIVAGESIANELGDEHATGDFVRGSVNYRGLVGMVERAKNRRDKPTIVRPGDYAYIFDLSSTLD